MISFKNDNDLICNIFKYKIYYCSLIGFGNFILIHLMASKLLFKLTILIPFIK